jgi:hypothetical protein
VVWIAYGIKMSAYGFVSDAAMQAGFTATRLL